MRLCNLKPKLRKWTTPIHFLCGVLIALTVVVLSVQLAIALAFIFIADEVIQALGDNNSAIAEAEKDIWEIELVIFVAIGIIDVLMLVHPFWFYCVLV